MFVIFVPVAKSDGRFPLVMTTLQNNWLLVLSFLFCFSKAIRATPFYKDSQTEQVLAEAPAIVLIARVLVLWF